MCSCIIASMTRNLNMDTRSSSSRCIIFAAATAAATLQHSGSGSSTTQAAADWQRCFGGNDSISSAAVPQQW
jgi:hypothetical protein